jgi:hypothetical protein
MAGNSRHPVLTLVHDFGPNDPRAWGPVVALAPGVAADQHRAGIGFLTLHDFSDRRALVVDPRSRLLVWQWRWLERLAEATGTALDVARAPFGYLKPPLDSVIALSRLLRATIEGARADAVRYVGPESTDEADPWHGYHMMFAPQLGDRPLAERLLPAVCAQLGVPLSLETFPVAAVPGPGGPTPWAAQLASRVRSPLARSVNFWPSGSWRSEGPASLLLWPGGYGARLVARAERARGRRVAVTDRDAPEPRIRQALPGGWRDLSGPIDVSLGPPAPLTPALGGLVDELTEWTGVPGTPGALASRVATYAQRVGPAVERIAGRLEPVLREGAFVRLTAANPYTLVEYGALVAATRLGVDRLLVQHGDHAYPYDFWLVEETQNFTRLAVSDPTVPADLARAGADLGLDVPDFELWTPRLAQFARTRRRDPGHGPVCYLPTVFLGDNTFMIGCGIEDSWYFRWQLRLLEVMAQHDHLSFIWKSLPDSSHGAVGALEALVARVANVRFETRPFRELAPTVGCLLTDFASTGLYEALALGVPSLALSFSDFEDIRPRAQAMLGPVLRPCAGMEDAEQAVREFLDRTPA